MGFWISFFVSLALTVVGELLRPKQKFKDPKPSALGEFNFPTADSSRVIPWWWGTCKIAGPNTTWYGDLATVAIRKKVKTGWFSSTKITQGYKYYLGVQLVFGYGPLDDVIELQMDDKPVFGPGGTVGAGDVWAFEINKPKLLGNDDPPNGVSGPAKLYKGTFAQIGNEYLRQQWGEVEVSAFRPLIHLVLEHCYLGNSDTPPPITLIGRRTPNPLALPSGHHNIDGGANAANMCYEVMTDLTGGMKIPAGEIDTASFVACGATIFQEGLGLSMQADTPTQGKALLGEILRHVDGVIYADPVTGKYTMKLARDDYVFANLPIFDETNTDADGFEFSRISWEDTKNTTIINYLDRAKGFVVIPVQYQDSANIFVRKGQIDSEQIDFLGFSNATQANTVAARVNKTRSSPLCRVQFNTDRTGYSLRPGSVLRMTRADFGIVDLVLRVIEISYGKLDEPRVQVTCTEDIYAINSFAFQPPTGTDWVPPGGPPVALAAQRLEEAPHFGVDDDRAYVLTLAAKAGAFVLGYEVWSDATGGVAYQPTNDVSDFTPTGLLTTAYNASSPEVDETGFTINTGIDIANVSAGPVADRDDGLNLVLIDNEIMAWREKVDNGGGSYTFKGVYRGVLDTVPADHGSGARVWFFSEGVGLTRPDGYVSNVTVNAKLLPKNNISTLPIVSATNMALTTASRSLKPLPPGLVRINATRPADIIGTVTGSFALTWAHRNRNDTTIKNQTDPSATIEPGIAYNVRFYNAATNGLIISKLGMTATSASVGLAYTGNVRMELESTRDGNVSRQRHNLTFAYDAGGITTSVITADQTVYVLDGGKP